MVFNILNERHLAEVYCLYLPCYINVDARQLTNRFLDAEPRAPRGAANGDTRPPTSPYQDW